MVSYLWIFVLKPQSSLCGTWGRQSIAGTGFSSAALVFAYQYYLTSASYTFMYYQDCIILANDSP